jgi:hypothetical protein
MQAVISASAQEDEFVKEYLITAAKVNERFRADKKLGTIQWLCSWHDNT